jgi:hypothetical protein
MRHSKFNALTLHHPNCFLHYLDEAFAPLELFGYLLHSVSNDYFAPTTTMGKGDQLTQMMQDREIRAVGQLDNEEID